MRTRGYPRHNLGIDVFALLLLHTVIRQVHVQCDVITNDSNLSQVCMFTFSFRGIDVVRNKIKLFAQQKVTLPRSRHKIIILDEADR